MSFYEMSTAGKAWLSTGISVVGLVVVLLFVMLCMSQCPTYNVWSAEMEGKAQLAKAEQNRQIQVAQSKAKADAAEFEAKSEVTRAGGVAQANKIIGDSLKNNEAYLRYLYINGLMEGKDHTQIIYVPTEASMPILEAGRALGGQKQ